MSRVMNPLDMPVSISKMKLVFTAMRCSKSDKKYLLKLYYIQIKRFMVIAAINTLCVPGIIQIVSKQSAIGTIVYYSLAIEYHFLLKKKLRATG